MNTIEKQVADILREMSPVGEQPGEDDLLEELGFDSLKRVELAVALEDALDIQFDQSDLEEENFQRVSDVVALVARYVEG